MPSLKILFRMSCLKKAPRRLSRFITKPRPPVILSGATRPFLAHLFCAPGRVAKNLSSLRSAFRKPSVAFALLLAVSSIIPARVSSQTSEAQIEQSFRAGQQALNQVDFTHAAEDFKKVLALDPSLVEAEVNLGLAYQSLFEYDLAVRLLEKALRERPNLLGPTDRKSTRLNSSHGYISYAVFCLKKKKQNSTISRAPQMLRIHRPPY